ncbi:MAG: hypothetical protein LBG27_13440 [Spirochaetaceae bacterium]|jgi:hypothetical protein|nr:hypothetical protein [Spirochaetaceae bacterium]
MDENEIVCRYYERNKGRNVKGINILTAFYTAENGYGKLQTPADYQIISKTRIETGSKTGKERRVSGKSKNELMREMIRQTIQKHVKFGYILAGSWFAPVENMRFTSGERKAFIFEINDNRLAAVSGQEREKGRFIRIDRMEMPDEEPAPVYLKDLRFPAILYKQVFKNKDGSAGVRYLASNDGTMSRDRFKTLYQKRWSVEVYHESIQQNTSIGRSPARTERTQSNHIFASI